MDKENSEVERGDKGRDKAVSLGLARTDFTAFRGTGGIIWGIPRNLKKSRYTIREIRKCGWDAFGGERCVLPVGIGLAFRLDPTPFQSQPECGATSVFPGMIGCLRFAVEAKFTRPRVASWNQIHGLLLL